jgi:hypothetical protein
MKDLDNTVSYDSGSKEVEYTLPSTQNRVGSLFSAIDSGCSKKDLQVYFKGIIGVDQLPGNQSTIVGRIANKKYILSNGWKQTTDGSYKSLTLDDLKSDIENEMSAKKLHNKYGSRFNVKNAILWNSNEKDRNRNLEHVLRQKTGDTDLKEYEPILLEFSDLYEDVGKGIGTSKLKDKYKSSDVADLIDILSPQQSKVDVRANQEKLMRHEMYNGIDVEEKSTLQNVIEDIYAGACAKTLTELHGSTFAIVGTLENNWSWKDRAQNAHTIVKHYLDQIQTDEEIVSLKDVFEQNLSYVELKSDKIKNNSSTWDEIDSALCLLENELPEKITYGLELTQDPEPSTIMDDDEKYNGSLTIPSTGWESDGDDYLDAADDAAINYRNKGTIRDEEGFDLLIEKSDDDWLDQKISKNRWIHNSNRKQVSETLFADRSVLYDRELGHAFVENGYFNLSEGGKRFVSKVTIGPKNDGLVLDTPNKDAFDLIDGEYLGQYDDFSPNDYNVAKLDDDWLGDLSLDDDIEASTNLDLLLLSSLESTPDEVEDWTYTEESELFFEDVSSDAVVDLEGPLKVLEAKGLREINSGNNEVETWEYKEEPEPEPVFIDVTDSEPFNPEQRGTYATASRRGISADSDPIAVFVDPESVEAFDRKAILPSVVNSKKDEQTLPDIIKDKRDFTSSVKESKIDDTEIWRYKSQDEPFVEDWTTFGQETFDPLQRGTYNVPSSEDATIDLEKEDGTETWVFPEESKPKKKRRKKKKRKKSKSPRIAAGILAAVTASTPGLAGAPEMDEDKITTQEFSPVYLPTGSSLLWDEE